MSCLQGCVPSWVHVRNISVSRRCAVYLLARIIPVWFMCIWISCWGVSLIKWVPLCRLRVRALCILPGQSFGLIAVYVFLFVFSQRSHNKDIRTASLIFRVSSILSSIPHWSTVTMYFCVCIFYCWTALRGWSCVCLHLPAALLHAVLLSWSSHM